MKKYTTRTHDAFVKELLHHKEAAIDFIRHVLPKEVAVLLDLDALRYADTSYTHKKMGKLVSDVVFLIPVRAGLGLAEVTVLIEHKSY
jgi:predicted transposase YdaD